jgi:DHA2 family multidrug resistance protein
MFAGQISESLGWQWGFWMIVPVAVAAVAGNILFLPRGRANASARLDWLGFISLSAGIAAAQLVFSRGQRLDWFESTEIIVATLIAGIAIYMFCAHSLTSAKPFVRLTLLRDRNYSVGLLLVTLFGMLNFSVIVLLPPLLQQQAGFPDSAIGEIVGARGIGSAIGFFAAMPMARIDPRISMTIGALLQAIAGLWLMSLDLNADLATLILCSALQGTSIGVLWVPMTTIAFSTLAAEMRAEALSIFHLLRNFGSSLFISLSILVLVRSTSTNYARMTEFITPYQKMLMLQGLPEPWNPETTKGLLTLSNEIQRQAAMIGYVNAFYMMACTAAAAVPLACLLRSAARGR